MINTTNLIALKIKQIQPNSFESNKTADTQPAQTNTASGLLSAYLNNLAMINTPAVKKSETTTPVNYHNNFRTMIQNNQAKILAIVMRTFNAKDTNGNDYIDGNEQNGTFLNAIERLDEVKAQGFNTLHVLPIHPPGKMKAMGTAGSIYAPKDMLAIDPNLVDKNDPRSDKEQFKAFIDECHKRGIKVMLDMPSCASYDMFLEHPEWMAKERDGLAKTPQGWNDIRMFQPWEDEGKRTLNPKLLELHKQYVDMCIDLGIDGIRSDVARAKPVEFWDIIIPYSHMRDPEFAWLEGITNAVTHRNYAMRGEHIKIFIFDDRMEIRSPGKLPGLVTLENMKKVRYARNTKISETLVDLGLVKELNEGVSRIYEEMAKFFLDEPEYVYEEGDILKLTLKNNIVMRDKRISETLQKKLNIKEDWEKLPAFERNIIRYISDKGEAGTTELIKYTGRSKNTVLNVLKKLEELQIIEWVGTNINDPKKRYILKQ